MWRSVFCLWSRSNHCRSSQVLLSADFLILWDHKGLRHCVLKFGPFQHFGSEPSTSLSFVSSDSVPRSRRILWMCTLSWCQYWSTLECKTEINLCSFALTSLHCSTVVCFLPFQVSFWMIAWKGVGDCVSWSFLWSVKTVRCERTQGNKMLMWGKQVFF